MTGFDFYQEILTHERLLRVNIISTEKRELWGKKWQTTIETPSWHSLRPDQQHAWNIIAEKLCK